jgi:hypothetical protein
MHLHLAACTRRAPAFIMLAVLSVATTAPLAMTATPTDLRLEELVLDQSSAESGGSVRATLSIANRGATAAESVILTLSLSSTPDISTSLSADRLASAALHTLQPGESLTYVLTFLVPSSPPGNYYVIAELVGLTADLTATDNVKSSALHVVAAAPSLDEPASSVSAPSADSIAASAPCTHYASPSGTGNGLSAASPFTVSKFWNVAASGKTLCLLDGIYKGSSSMITPPSGRNGAAGSPITVRALNDGKVLIDGQGVRGPVVLNNNDYWVLEGFNAARSLGTVILVKKGSANNVLRRLAAWDAHEGNYPVIGVNGSGTSKNLLEDVAAWGIGRNTIAFAANASDNTCRRCWARWEGSHAIGPKVVFQLAYDSLRHTCENCISTWTAERMVFPYLLLDQYGKPCRLSQYYLCEKWLTVIDQPCCLFSATTNNSSTATVDARILGSVGYVRSTARVKTPLGYKGGHQAVDLLFENSVFYADSGVNTRPLQLHNAVWPGDLMIAQKMTTIGGSASHIGSDWIVTNLAVGATVGGVPNVYAANQICTRYVNRAQTTTPLWPWPMNDRIIAGMVQSGRASVDVTATIESMLGPIPLVCRQ